MNKKRIKKVIRINCGFLSESVPRCLMTVCRGLSGGWMCHKDEDDNGWVFRKPDYALTFRAVPNEDGTFCYSDSIAFEKDGLSEFEAINWIKEKIRTFDAISSFDSLNSSIDSNAKKRIVTVFRNAQQGVFTSAEGFRYRDLRENKTEDSVIGTLEYKGEWVTKSTLSADFGELQDEWVFCPNYTPEGRGRDYRTSGHSYGYETSGYVDWHDVTYTMISKADSAVSRDKQIEYQLVVHLQDLYEAIIQNPPPRLYPLFYKEGVLADKDLTKLRDKRGLLNLVRQGIITGRKLLKARPDLWEPLFKEGYITENDVYKTNPNKLFWLAKNGFIPPERAVAIDPSLQRKLEQAGFDFDTTYSGANDPQSIIEAVREGKLTPQRAWARDSKILKDLVTEGLATPDEAVVLDPTLVNWLLANGFVGRSWAVKRKPESRLKSELKKQGVEWESLKASRNLDSHLGGEERTLTDDELSFYFNEGIDELSKDPTDQTWAEMNSAVRRCEINPFEYPGNIRNQWKAWFRWALSEDRNSAEVIWDLVHPYSSENTNLDPLIDRPSRNNRTMSDLPTASEFVEALQYLSSDYSVLNDLEGLEEEVGFTHEDVGGWSSWFDALDMHGKKTAWGYVSWALDDLDSSRQLDTEDEDDWEDADQRYTSKATAINGKNGRVPALFNKINWKSGTINLDYGGGDENSDAVAKEFFKDKGVKSYIYDKYNQTPKHNSEVINEIKKAGGADTATLSNVLNVIAEEEARKAVLKNIHRLLKNGGTLYIYGYSGNKADQERGGRTTGKDQWQNFKKGKEYVPEVVSVFGEDNVKSKGELIIATK